MAAPTPYPPGIAPVARIYPSERAETVLLRFEDGSARWRPAPNSYLVGLEMLMPVVTSERYREFDTYTPKLISVDVVMGDVDHEVVMSPGPVAVGGSGAGGGAYVKFGASLVGIRNQGAFCRRLKHIHRFSEGRDELWGLNADALPADARLLIRLAPFPPPRVGNAVEEVTILFKVTYLELLEQDEVTREWTRITESGTTPLTP
jgi:hypothetical protein